MSKWLLVLCVVLITTTGFATWGPERGMRECILTPRTDLVYCVNHGLHSGDPLHFLGHTGGVTPHQRYYVAATIGLNNFTISETRRGPEVDLVPPGGPNRFQREN